MATCTLFHVVTVGCVTRCMSTASSLYVLSPDIMPGTWRTSPPYAPLKGDAKHSARCFCGRVSFGAASEPTRSTLCSCTECNRLHGTVDRWTCECRLACLAPDGPSQLAPALFILAASETTHGAHSCTHTLSQTRACAHMHATLGLVPVFSSLRAHAVLRLALGCVSMRHTHTHAHAHAHAHARVLHPCDAHARVARCT